MSQCHNCGTQVNQNATVCPECGVTIHDGTDPGGHHQTQQTESAPTGIKALSVVSALSGVVLVLLGAANWVFAGQVESTDAENSAEMASTIGDIAVVIAVLGVVGLVAMYGLWKLRKWGWLVGVGYFAIHALAGIVFFVNGRTPMLAYGAVAAALLGYLWRERDLFRATSAPPGNTPQTNQY